MAQGLVEVERDQQPAVTPRALTRVRYQLNVLAVVLKGLGKPA